MQAYEGTAQIIMAGTDSVLRAMETYTKQAWVLRAWQDVFVDLVQGQLQHLYVSLLSSELPPATPSVPNMITLVPSVIEAQMRQLCMSLSWRRLLAAVTVGRCRLMRCVIHKPARCQHHLGLLQGRP